MAQRTKKFLIAMVVFTPKSRIYTIEAALGPPRPIERSSPGLTKTILMECRKEFRLLADASYIDPDGV